MPNPNSQEEIYDRAIKFANDCGEQALGERDFDKIKKLYIGFANDIQSLIQTREKKLVKQMDAEIRLKILDSVIGLAEVNIPTDYRKEFVVRLKNLRTIVTERYQEWKNQSGQNAP